MIALTALLSTLSAPAHAAIVSATYCVEYTLDYTDGATGDLLTGTTMNARGALLRFIRPNGTHFGHYLNESAPDVGCATVLIDDAITYTIRVVSTAQVAGHTINVNAGLGTLYATTVETSFTPTSGTHPTWVLAASDWNRVMAAAAHTLHRETFLGSSETFDFWLASCPVIGSSCYSPPERDIYIASNHDEYKFIVGHELGHAIAHAANGFDAADRDDSAVVGDCTPAYTNVGHRMNSKEFQSVAAVEGVAHFVSAVAFNQNIVETDCDMMKHYRPDWDRSGTQTADDVAIFSCEFGVTGPTNNVVADSQDYLGDHCIASGAVNNRATEYDWLRHLWDLYTDDAVSAETLFDIWGAANPDSWNANGAGTGGDYPAARMSTAAFAVGGLPLQLDYNDGASYNGVDR